MFAALFMYLVITVLTFTAFHEILKEPKKFHYLYGNNILTMGTFEGSDSQFSYLLESMKNHYNFVIEI